MGGLQFGEFRSRASSVGDVSSAAANSTVAETFDALNRNKPDIAGINRKGVEAFGVIERATKDANAEALRNKYAREHELEILEKEINAASKAAQKQADSDNKNSLIKAGGMLLGTALMSDETTKNTIEKIEDALSQLRGLQPVTYYYNEEYSSSPERLHHGFIAQEYQKVMPDATYFDESTGKLCIDTAELIALLVRGIQQLETRVTRMEAAHALIGAK